MTKRQKALADAIAWRNYCVQKLCIEATRHALASVEVPAELLSEAVSLQWEARLLGGSRGVS